SSSSSVECRTGAGGSASGSLRGPALALVVVRDGLRRERVPRFDERLSLVVRGVEEHEPLLQGGERTDSALADHEYALAFGRRLETRLDHFARPTLQELHGPQPEQAPGHGTTLQRPRSRREATVPRVPLTERGAATSAIRSPPDRLRAADRRRP